MKKIYLCLMMLFSLVGTASVSAEDVIASLGEPLTSLESLQPGSQVVLYNNGRTGYLKENADQSLVLPDVIPFSELESQDFLWTLETLTKNSDGTAVATFRSYRGNYIPALVSGQANSTSSTPDTYTITASATGTALWNIQGTGGLYFNGNGADANGNKSFTGWSAAGGNSDYQIIVPTLKQIDVVTVNIAYVDVNTGTEIQPASELRGVTGMVVENAPAIAHYTFVSALDGNMGEPFEFPVTVNESTSWVLTYSAWPHVVFNCLTEDGDTLGVVDNYYEAGTTVELPSFAGYTLVTEGYEDGYTVTEDAEIDLTYRVGGNLPFETTTVTDGQFAADTKWYTMALRGTKYLQYEPNDVDNNYTLVTAPASIPDSLRWCFTGDVNNGFKIYNKAAGTAKVLTALGTENGNSIIMQDDTTEPANNVFTISVNGNGWAFTVQGTDYACLNDYQAVNNLKIWNDSRAPLDQGSSIVIEEYDSIALAKRTYLPYLNAEDCVGGWTAAALTDLRTAYENNDIAAMADALTILEASTDTIAFDPDATYELISAYRAFTTQQPGKIYALYNAVDAAGSNYLGWKELDGDDDSFQWYFTPGEQEGTYTIGSISSVMDARDDASLEPTYVNEFRFGGQAMLVPEDEAGEYTLVKSTVEPAAYNFICYYTTESGGTDKITLCAGQGSLNASLTEGTITTYNTLENQYANTWRLRPVGTTSAIGSVTVGEEAGERKPVIYDLTGRRVQKATKGIYIINGKKVYVK